jgi:hypothetical protein
MQMVLSEMNLPMTESALHSELLKIATLACCRKGLGGTAALLILIDGLLGRSILPLITEKPPILIIVPSNCY